LVYTIFIQQVCQALRERGVAHAIVGGYAVALHGAVRGTMDVDIAIRWNLKNLQAAETALLNLGLVSLLPIRAKDIFQFRDEYIRNRNLIAWNFYHPDNPAQQVDIIINYDLTGHKIRTVTTSAGDLKILALDDLIAMKQESGREQDLADVSSLQTIKQRTGKNKTGKTRT
jgi:hypothetical protein